MHQYIKIKVVSLAEEARLIRRDQNRRLEKATWARYQQKHDRAAYHHLNFAGLHHHRVTVVRSEARAANLAYAFVNGYAYADVERFAWEEPFWGKIRDLVRRYGEDKDRTERYNLWEAKGRTQFHERLQARKEVIAQRKLDNEVVATGV